MKRINALAALILLAGSPFAVGVQWELPGAVARRDQGLAL
jgi:hypothetical protein